MCRRAGSSLRQAACLLRALLPGTQLEQIVGAPEHTEVRMRTLMHGIQLHDGAVGFLPPPLFPHGKDISHFQSSRIFIVVY